MFLEAYEIKIITKMRPRNETWAWKWSCIAKIEAASWKKIYMGFKVQEHFVFHSKNLRIISCPKKMLQGAGRTSLRNGILPNELKYKFLTSSASNNRPRGHIHVLDSKNYSSEISFRTRCFFFFTAKNIKIPTLSSYLKFFLNCEI